MKRKKENEFEKDMKDLEQWQEQQYSPGHFIGTGKIPRPILKSPKHGKVLIILGVIGLLLPIGGLIFTEAQLMNLAFMFFLPLVFIIGGVLRLKKHG